MGIAAFPLLATADLILNRPMLQKKLEIQSQDWMMNLHGLKPAVSFLTFKLGLSSAYESEPSELALTPTLTDGELSLN